MKRVGLTLGKFAPFHQGHQHLVECALKEVDELILIIYDAKDVTSVPLKVRANWIRALYPAVHVIEGKGGPTVTGYTAEIKRIQEDYVLSLLNGKRVTHFYSSEPYGEHMSAALGAQNCVVDQERRRYPISGTLIRKDPFQHREFIHPLVYRDLISNIAFLGAPSTGKTTIAEACAKHFKTTWMPEYGREYWEKNQVDRRLTAHQLVELAEGHLEREDARLLEANRFLFTDTNALTTYMFSIYYHGFALERLAELAFQAERRYHMIFVCEPDIPYDDTWDRSGDVNRKQFQQQIIDDLQRRKVRYTLLSGSVEERLAKVREAIDERAAGSLWC